jgi:hypothetical protein
MGHEPAHFFSLWWNGVFEGVFGKTGCTLWCFCGEFVVLCVVEDGRLRPLFRREKYDTILNFIFGFLPVADVEFLLW